MAGAIGVWLMKAILVLVLETSLVFTEAKTLSKNEYLAMKRHLKILNKPAVKSFKTDYGDIFDCVDINKQLAFDHPLMKNHTVQMQPSSFPTRNDNRVYSTTDLDIGLPDDGCPIGTVPIRRVTMQDLMRAPSPSEFGKKYVLNDSEVIFTTGPPARHHWAQDDTNDGEFYGTKVIINLWKPNIVYWNKFSLSQFWISSGPYEKLNTIEAGWTVNPRAFNDYNVRLFSYWTADGYHNTGCLNVNCPGFVQISRKIPLGVKIYPLSTYGGYQCEITLLSFLDPNSKQWWLIVGNESIGYWPNHIFNSLSGKADRIHWGGEVYNPDEAVLQLKSDMPPMGSGHFAEEGYGKSSFMRAMQVVIANNTIVDAPKTHPFVDTPKCYNMIDKGHFDSWGRTFFFGGPGGKCL
ncbi:protein neprosin-like [Aristolochia californica]|uniref:protein neprosin-like n=1 Tax=Aristolochia californica TaxID=171875 RepID=UPI0035DC7B03